MPQYFQMTHEFPKQSVSVDDTSSSPSKTTHMDRTSGQTALGEPARPVAKRAVKPDPLRGVLAERIPEMVPDLFTPSQLLDLTAASLPNFNLVDGTARPPSR